VDRARVVRVTSFDPAGRTLRKAAVVAVGSELLTPWRIDTNSLYVTERLDDLGIEVVMKAVVGDSAEEIDAAFRQALHRAHLVVLTGGLGPTADDLTRDVVSAALDLTLEEDETITARIRARFEARGWRMPENNRRQAMVPRGAQVIENPNGTAPGLWIERKDAVVLMLPGPPRELQPMLDRLVTGPLAARSGPERLRRRVLRIAGRAESHVEELTQPVYSAWQSQDLPIDTTILAAPGQIELHLSVRTPDPETGQRRLDQAVQELRGVLGRDLFTVDGKLLEEVVGELLRSRAERVAIAESCTGGLVASRLTDVPGSSEYVERGVVCYSNASKVELLGVAASLIDEHGAVSEPVASAMAAGMRERARTDWAVAVTGIAGPGGGSDLKPVGTVAIAVAGPLGRARVKTVRFPGGRLQVKTQASQVALDLLRRMLEDASGSPGAR
jgi:nicotinamide-nucleotide amidase